MYRAWEEELSKMTNHHNKEKSSRLYKPSLLRVIFRTMRSKFIVYGVLTFFQDCVIRYYSIKKSKIIESNEIIVVIL